MRPHEDDSAKLEWVHALPNTPPEKSVAARRLDAAPVDDREFEMSDYGRMADPTFQLVETAQRRWRGQFIRRLKRLSMRQKHEA